MIRRLWDSTVAWTMLSTAVLAGHGLVTLPIQVITLSPEQMGIWYSFMAISSFVVLIGNGGIAGTVQRFSSYYHAGASDVPPQGVPKGGGEGPNQAALSALAVASERFFLIFSLVGLALMTAAGMVFVSFTVTDAALVGEARVAWLLQAIAVAILIHSCGRVAIVQGAGGMLHSQRRLVMARCLAPLVAAAALVSGFGVVSLGLATLILAIVQTATHRKRYGEILRAAAFDQNLGREILLRMWPTAWRFSLVTSGAWMITTAGVILIGTFLGLHAAGSYGLTLQLVQFMMTVSAVWMTSAIPQLCTLRAKNDENALRHLFLSRWSLGLGTYLIMATVLILLGPEVLRVIGSRSDLLHFGPLLLLCFIALLEVNHGPLCAAYLMSANQVPFVTAALGSGISTIALSLIFITCSSLGIWSVILAQGISQVFYNNWRWPMLAFQDIARNTK